MPPRRVLDYENPQVRYARDHRSARPVSKTVLYRTGVGIGALFAWWALLTSQDGTDPFVAEYEVYLDRSYFFLPLLALVVVAFEARCYIAEHLSLNPRRPRVAGAIVVAVLLPTAYFAFIEGGTAITGDVRFVYQAPALCFASFWLVSFAIVTAVGLFFRAPVKADTLWLAAGWAAPNVFAGTFEGFKFLGQSMTRSPAGINEYSPGGFLYWTFACIIGLLAVPFLVALIFQPPESLKQYTSENPAQPTTHE